MNLQTKDLAKLRKPLEDALNQHQILLSKRGHIVKFDKFPDLKFTTNKPYTAETTIPLLEDNKEIGQLDVKLLQKYEGTGNNNTYKTTEVTIPKSLSFSLQPERVIPEYKKDIIKEGFLPLFSKLDDITKLFTNYIIQIGITEQKELIPKWIHGPKLNEYYETMMFDKKTKPHNYAIIGTNRGEPNIPQSSFGNPNALYNPLSEDNIIQVFGILSVANTNHKLNTLINGRWRKPSKNKQYNNN